LVLEHPHLRVSPAAWARRVARFDARFPPSLDEALGSSSSSGSGGGKDEDDNEPLELG
jgi:hypothetical protein